MVATALSGREPQVEAQMTRPRTDLAQNISRYVAWGATSLVVLTLLLWLPFRQYNQLLTFSGIALLVAAGAWLYPLLHRLDHARSGIHLLLSLILLSTAALPLLLPETLLTVAIGYVFLAIVAHMLLGAQHSRWFAGVSLVAFVGDVVLVEAVQLDWFTPLDRGAGLAVMAVSGAFVLLVVMLIARQLVRSQEGALGDAWQASRELATRAQAEQQRREHLQTVVQEYAAHMERVGAGELAARLSLDRGPQSTLSQDNPLMLLGQGLNQMTGAIRDGDSLL